MIVLKFGGTSVGSAESARNVIEIVRGRLDRKPVIVVSALSKVTDLLYRIADGGAELEDNIKALKDRHFRLIRELIPNDRKLCIGTQKKIQDIVDGIEKTVAAGAMQDRDKASVIACGELMSSTIMCAALCANGINTVWADARGFIVATGDPLKSEPDSDEIAERTLPAIEKAFSASEGAEAVITQGFICSTPAGRSALLGRGGSDYSASLIGMAIGAEAVEIWTDVDGVRTADPRRVPTTACIKRISYEEAAEMAHFGAKVLHPLTLEPVQAHNIPVYVKNTHNPDGECTVILNREEVEDAVKSVSYKENILVLNMISRIPMDSAGFIKKIFDVLSDNRISVDLVSTNNSRISITTDAGHKNIDKAIGEIEQFAQVVAEKDKAQISAICNSVSDMNGILRMSFAPLRDSKIYMISPGASFINVSFVVDRDSLDGMLCLTHKELIENESCN